MWRPSEVPIVWSLRSSSVSVITANSEPNVLNLQQNNLNTAFAVVQLPNRAAGNGHRYSTPAIPLFATNEPISKNAHLFLDLNSLTKRDALSLKIHSTSKDDLEKFFETLHRAKSNSTSSYKEIDLTSLSEGYGVRKVELADDPDEKRYFVLKLKLTGNEKDSQGNKIVAGIIPLVTTDSTRSSWGNFCPELQLATDKEGKPFIVLPFKEQLVAIDQKGSIYLAKI